MIFKLSTAGFCYSDVNQTNLINLANLGFIFHKDQKAGWIKDSNISPKIEINSIEALVEFSRKWGDVIISAEDEEPEITIYDDYME